MYDDNCVCVHNVHDKYATICQSPQINQPLTPAGLVQYNGSLVCCSHTELYCTVQSSQRYSLTVRLSVGLQDLDVHRRVDATEDLSGFVSVVFVTGVDGAGLPVGPVQGLLRQC